MRHSFAKNTENNVLYPIKCIFYPICHSMNNKNPFLGFVSPIKIPTHFAWVDNVQTITYALYIIIICYPVNFSIYQINSGSSHLWVDKSNSMVALRISVFWFVLTEVKYLAEGNK